MASDKLQRSKRAKPISRIRVSSPESVKPGVVRVDSEKKKIMESSVAQQNQNQNRLPLAQVVSDCVKRWFQDTLKEAKAGDSAMQVLVGQMYSRGYGVPKDPFKLLFNAMEILCTTLFWFVTCKLGSSSGNSSPRKNKAEDEVVVQDSSDLCNYQ
uniref:Uncharacterized protein n=1 Tax=Fagus sylvatica TaxID=28930 RepID=A0A2N9J7U6_FAGSY